MNSVVFLAPGLADGPVGDCALSQDLPSVQALAEKSRVFVLNPAPQTQPVEALWLGFPPDHVDMADGPLLVAALGFEPPERSVHYCATLLSIEDGLLQRLKHALPTDLATHIAETLKQLDTTKLRFLRGRDAQHALVHEDGSAEGRFLDPVDVVGQPLPDCLPVGEEERTFRRYIDDSANLLFEQEFNSRRIDEGLPPISVVWPWGQGFRQKLPLLPLRRGQVAFWQSDSYALKGLCKLSGYRHGEVSAFGAGTAVRWPGLAEFAMAKPLTGIAVESWRDFQTAGRREEASWLAKEWDAGFIEAILTLAQRSPVELTILCPSTLPTERGIGLSFSSVNQTDNVWPFDSRILDESRVERKDVWNIAERALTAENLPHGPQSIP